MCTQFKSICLVVFLMVQSTLSAGAFQVVPGPARLPEAEFSLPYVLTDCDLIVLGSLAGLGVPRTVGSHLVSEIDVVRLVASASTLQDTERTVARDKDGTLRVLVAEKSAFSLQHPRLPLFLGATYLLFLKRADIGAGGAPNAPPSQPCFYVLAGAKGTILVSDPKEIRHYDRIMEHIKSLGVEMLSLFAQQDELLQRSCGTKDARAVLAAVETLAWAMADETLGRLVLEKLAQSDQPLYATPAKELLRLPSVKRFRFVSRDAGDAVPGKPK
jgi:hypothetical protein